ncbi:DUF2484 family protein [Alphaproteobacteria bacterium GH1-50]|uniref:DUF2484 family protein n=1 Tax=Kangsaoukella pontilimi TaxID=2691042 RepID=A0A7C9IFS6_9RHOB|nr:DUF2484 family protein [Kangsaoukella pontilimi]MXQ07509.1 DUF2484 family protein [Kangsaoukella pontilimi]
MSPALIAASLWAIAATVVALLPMRWQYPPGIALLIAAPVLLGWIAMLHGVVPMLVGTLAFLSMFRNPLKYLAYRAMGKPWEGPA